MFTFFFDSLTKKKIRRKFVFVNCQLLNERKIRESLFTLLFTKVNYFKQFWGANFLKFDEENWETLFTFRLPSFILTFFLSNFSLAFFRKIWVHKLKQLINAANFSVPASIFLVKMTPVNELELNEKSLFTNDTKTKEEPLNHGCCRSKHTKGCCIATGVFGGLFLGEFSHDFWRKNSQFLFTFNLTTNHDFFTFKFF